MCPGNRTSLFYPLSIFDTNKDIITVSNSEKQIETKM